MKFDVVIGNPPYGNQGKMAIDFLATHGKIVKEDGVIMQVLPSSIRKESCQNKLIKENAFMECIRDEDVDGEVFPGDIRAVYQTWVYTDKQRTKIETISGHRDFTFLPHCQRFNANLFIGRVGSGPSGKVLTENFHHYAEGHYFVRAYCQETIDILLSLQSKFIEASKRSNGRRSLSKQDIVELYKECLNGKESAQPAGRLFD
jgi:hypothetical protein